MIQVSKVVFSAALCGVLVTGADAAISVVTDITTTPAFEAVDTAAHVLDSFSDTTGSFDSLTFSTVTNAADTTLVHGETGAAPASGNEALSGSRVDTGKLGTGQGTVFQLTPAAVSDKLFIIFNASDSVTFYQGPGTVTAVAGDNSVLGSVVVNTSGDGVDGVGDAVLSSDSFTPADLQIVGGNLLAGRLLLGVTIDVADFGVGDLGTIAGFTISGEVEAGTFGNVNSFDVHTVGLAAIPEPSSMGLALAGLLSVVAHRRR